MKTKTQIIVFIKLLTISTLFFVVSCSAEVAGSFLLTSAFTSEKPLTLSKAKLIPEKYQYQYRKQKPDTALLVLIKYKTAQYYGHGRKFGCIYLFEDDSSFIKKIYVESKHNKYFVACVRPREKIKMYIPLNGQQERKIILGLGPNDLTPRSEDKVNNIGFFEDLFGQAFALTKKTITIKKDKTQYYRWDDRSHSSFHYTDNP